MIAGIVSDTMYTLVYLFSVYFHAFGGSNTNTNLIAFTGQYCDFNIISYD